MRKILSLFLVFSLHFVSYGAYLENVPHQLTQPNGEVLNVFITGDEFFRRVHDAEGYSIVPGTDGWYFYANYDAELDELVPSEYIVTASRNFELPMKKGLRISYEKYIEKRRVYFEHTDCDISGASRNSILNNLANSGAKNVPQMNNIVICIGFSDTEGMTRSFPVADGMFNSNLNNNMRDYYRKMSYDKLDIVSHFYPPVEEDSVTLRFYRDSNPRAYYQPQSASNPLGYVNGDQRAQREHILLRNAVQWVNHNFPIPSSLNLDIDNDGRVDFLTFLVQGRVDGWSDLLWPHKWSFPSGYNVRINGKQVVDYNFNLDGGIDYFDVGVLCHEGYHVLGAPDLYHYVYTEGFGQAVGRYDIMDASFNSKPQSMSAYMKFKYGKWISKLPIAPLNKTSEIFNFYENDGSDIDKPVIFRIPMSQGFSEYGLVEYRKKSGTNYDAGLPNEGFMIYRINPSMIGNALAGVGFVDEIYLYRPGSAPREDDGSIYSQGNLNQAPFNTANGRTAFNKDTDPKPYNSYGIPDNNLNINTITYHPESDSYTFFYGDPEKMGLELNKEELLIGKLAGSPGSVTVISNMLWYVEIPESAKNWLTVSKNKGINEGIVKFIALEENISGAQRATEVTFFGSGRAITITVIQDTLEAVCNDLISNLNIDFDFEARFATLTWEQSLVMGTPRENRDTLWNNGMHAESLSQIGFQSCRWLDDYDRVVMADDFVVPNGRAWLIEEIMCSGRKAGQSSLPDYIGIAIYRDNGNSRPQDTPIIEIEKLTPIDGVANGKMKILLPEPIYISEHGKYWISIYGSYEGPTNKSKVYNIATTASSHGDKMCKWDPTTLNGNPDFNNWHPFESSISLYNGLSFMFLGTVTVPDRIFYNVYLDGNLIATEIEERSFQYKKPVKLSEDHNWCVATICGSGMEGDVTCIHTEALFYDIELVTDADRGFVSGSGNYGHWDEVTASATARDGFVFASWTKNGSKNIVSVENPYTFNAKEALNLIGNFEILVPFDDYTTTKWNNCFMLNLKKFYDDGFDVNSCLWYKNNKIIGEGFTFSAGKKITDVLDPDATYSYKITTYNRGLVHSSEKKIEEEPITTLHAYPNPVPQGSTLTIEGTKNGALVEIYNQMGSCVSRTVAEGVTVEVTLALPAGIYVVRSNNEEVKVIIQ